MWWWRKVRNHTYWVPGASLHADGPSYYVHDVALRLNEDGLSLYSAADQSVAEKITHYYALTLWDFSNLDFLLLPDATWNTLGLHPAQISYTEIHPYLSSLHYEVRGLTKELESQLAAIILGETERQARRARKADVLKAAPGYLNSDPTLRSFLHEEWEEKLSLC
jgi:hypothetical protein